MNKWILAAAGTLMVATTLHATVARAAAAPKEVTAAVADPARPASDRERDANRKPAESVAFAGVKPGDKVADLIPGGGYFTRIFSKVVGPKGHVYAVAPPKRPQASADAPNPADAVKAIAADPQFSNVSVEVARPTEFSLPEKVDAIWTSQNYHDIHNVPNVDMTAFNRKVFDALKPGGVFVVLDHSAEAGSGFRDTSTLHRIDADAVKKEVTAAGFKFDGQSNVLSNASDTRKVAVFDDSIRGKTDQFILKFRKPN
jgi:predicted methyltransferase